MSAPVDLFRFRPRHRALVASASGLGAGLVALAALGVLGPAAPLGWTLGAIGAALGPLYAASPAWRLQIAVDERGLTVRRGARVRVALPWVEVVRVIYSPTTSTMFIDGGAPERSVLVPGPGAPAPYDLPRKAELCRAVLARVDPAKVIEVGTLERYAP